MSIVPHHAAIGKGAQTFTCAAQQ